MEKKYIAYKFFPLYFERQAGDNFFLTIDNSEDVLQRFQNNM